MEFQVFKSMDEAQRQLPYPIVVVDNLLGTPRTSHIRWLDPAVDVFFQTFTGLTRAPNGDFLASKLLVLVQGRGSRASLNTAGAPRAQVGSFRLADGREAVWGIGLPDFRWESSGPAWVAWPAKSGQIVRRIEGIGYDIASVRPLAQQLASLER